MLTGKSSNLSEEIIRILHHDFIIFSSLHFRHQVTSTAINMVCRVIEKNKSTLHKKPVCILKIFSCSFIFMPSNNVTKTKVSPESNTPPKNVGYFTMRFPLLKKFIRKQFDSVGQLVIVKKID